MKVDSLYLWTVIAAWLHLIPSRTQKLRKPAFCTVLPLCVGNTIRCPTFFYDLDYLFCSVILLTSITSFDMTSDMFAYFCSRFLIWDATWSSFIGSPGSF